MNTTILQESSHFDNTYATLPEAFYQNSTPDKVPAPQLIAFNSSLASDIGIDFENMSEDELVCYFSGNCLFNGSVPLAQAYAGHQFGSFVNQLGDGRAILLGEIVNNKNKRYCIQLKGSGRTHFSRGGDGKSALGPVIREYIVSEAMHALGIPTTRALAMVSSGEKVWRQSGMIPGGIMTRVASSFLRVGSFEYFLARKDLGNLKQLADYAIAIHFPECREAQNPYLDFFRQVCLRQAQLVPRWMTVGFIHGVMNTDNTSICGETIDFGPCAFMEAYDPNTVFSSIDMHGRYSFINQGSIIGWNLTSLANCLSPLISDDQDNAKQLYIGVLEEFRDHFMHNWREGMLQKIGLLRREEQDVDLLNAFLDILHAEQIDYTLAFRFLGDVTSNNSRQERFTALFPQTTKSSAWLSQWRSRLTREQASPDQISNQMNHINPAFIPRNHKIEQAIKEAEETSNSFGRVHTLLEILKKPYEEQEEYREYMSPAEEHERVLQTFCGT